MNVIEIWQKLNRFPGGAFLFNKILARKVPYTGSIGAEILEIKEGYAHVQMSDKRAIRNHLNSIHAVALMNLAELTTGLAVMSAVPKEARAIIKGLSIEYIKKARGTIRAEATQEKILANESKEFFIETILKDSSGEIVSKAKAHWLVGPRPTK